MLVNLLILLAVLTATLVVLGVLAAALAARALLRPPRMTDGKAMYLLGRLSPEEVGLRYEDVQFRVHDHTTGRPLDLPAWWIPAREPADRCVVLLHAYADGKTGVIAWAPLWHELGFNILAIDLRAHGYAGGVHCTGGWSERHDIEQVLDELRAARPAETRRLVLHGIGLGAGIATAVAASRCARGDAPAAAVLESPFADYRTAAAYYLSQMSLPTRPLRALAVRFAQWLSGADFAAVRPAGLMPQVTCPLLVIAPVNDPHLPPTDERELCAALAARPPASGPADWWSPDAEHPLRSLHTDATAYRERLGVTIDPGG